jgi:hypothetical protein
MVGLKGIGKGFVVFCMFSVSNFGFCCEDEEVGGAASFRFSPPVAWQPSDTEDVVFLPNPGFFNATEPVDSSFVYYISQKLLRSGNRMESMIGTQYMIELYNRDYSPVLMLFEMVCGEAEKPLRSSLETLEEKLKENALKS